MRCEDRYFIYKPYCELDINDIKLIETDYNCHLYDDSYYTKCFTLYCIILSKVCNQGKRKVSKKRKQEIENDLQALANGFMPIKYLDYFNN